MTNSLSLELAKNLLFLIGSILFIGMTAIVLARSFKIPDVVMFLIFGIFFGSEGLGILNINSGSSFNQIIMIFGSSLIIFDGGASVRLKILKEVWVTILMLSTVGVVLTALLTACAAYYLLNIPPIEAFLLGAVIASTDPATLIPIFKQIKISDRVSSTIISESAFNDAVAAILTFTILNMVLKSGDFKIVHTLLDLFKQSIIGILVGGILGFIAAVFISHEKYKFLSEFTPIVTLMAVIAAYVGADGLHSSGFMAVFVFGIVFGNQDSLGFKLSTNEEIEFNDFIATNSLIMRMFIFIILGSQVDFKLINLYFISGMCVVLFLIFIARPITVLVCALPDSKAKWHRNELIFMSCKRETGVIPGALAAMLIGINAPHANLIAAVTFLAIFTTISVQATSTKWLATKLKLLIE